MATQEYWADSPMDRRQTPLAAWFPTLDAMIAPNDPVRLLDEVLQAVDWKDWEEKYRRQKGQPPLLLDTLRGPFSTGCTAASAAVGNSKKPATIASISLACGRPAHRS